MKNNRFQKLILPIVMFLLFFNLTKVFSQDFMMQGWYWDYPKTAEGYTWADTITQKAAQLGNAGFTYMWLPPLAKASSGAWSNGYDPKDLYDYGSYGATGYGTRIQLDQSVNALGANGVKVVADVVFNHRDGGAWEDNDGLKNYVNGYDWNSANNGDNPFPYDRMRNVLPIGGATGLGAGTYYFKVSSASGHSKYDNWEYKIYFYTNTTSNYQDDINEVEPNGGGDCEPDQGSQSVDLCYNYNCQIDPVGGCTIDEFKLTLDEGEFNSDGDVLYITWGNRGSGYSDARIYSIWYDDGIGGQEIVGQMKYQTMTDFSNMPSGLGGMHWSAFKPNNNRATNLGGDWDGMYFYYDYDQFQQETKDVLFDWAKWNWNNVGVRGFRMDAVKHFTPEFVGDLFDYLHDNGIDPGLAVGEWYSTGTGELAGWVNNVYSYMDDDTKGAIAPKIFDFALRESLRNACDGYGYDVRNVFGASLHDAEGLSGNNVVTFVNNHDFRDESGFASLIHNDPMLAYAYILTNNHLGLPSVFYPDYFGYPDDGTSYYPNDKSAHKSEIDALMEVHKNYIFGSSEVTYLTNYGTPYYNDLGVAESYVMTYQLNGTGGGSGPDVIVAINFGGSSVGFHQGVKDLPLGTTLDDVLGNSAHSTAVVEEWNGYNTIWIDLPARSYSVWVQNDAGVYVPGNHNDWDFDNDNKAWLKDIGGNTKYFGHTIIINPENEFKIVHGTTWDQNWGDGYWIDEFDKRWNIGAYGNNAIWKEFTDPHFVHLCIEDPSDYYGNQLPVGIMMLSETPATITNVYPVVSHSAPEGSSANVSISLSDNAAPEEKIYIRYTDDSWATNHIVQAAGGGTDFTAILPAASAGTERIYYALTSTADAASVGNDPDLLTIHYDINGGENYHYYVPGTDADNCLTFDGLGAHIKMNQSLNNDISNLTLEAWVKPEPSPDSFMPVVVNQLNLNGPQDYLQFGLGVSNNNRIQFIYDDINGIRDTVETGIDIVRRDAWNHIALRAVENAGLLDVSIFVNGFEVKSVAGLDCLYQGQGVREMFAGAAFLAADHFFKGAVDEIKVWDEARTDNEIQMDMCSYPEGAEQNLILYYAFEEGIGTATKDLSSKEYNASLEQIVGSELPHWTTANLPAIWIGSVSSDWTDSDNWGWYGRVPVVNDDVIITSWAANDPLMTGDLEVDELILNDHTPFRVSSGSSMTVTEGVYFKNTLRIKTNTPMIINSGIGL